MHQKSPARQRRLIAAAGVVTLGFAGLLGSTAAQAASEVSYGDIQAGETGSIIIHKHENQTGATVGDPAGGANPHTDPIAGAGFTAYELGGIDLTKPAGWDVLKSTKATASCDVTGSAATKGAAKPEVITDADGVATVGSLKVGAYLVCETTTPEGVSTPAQPFIVTIPFPDNQEGAPSNSNGWLYDVNVYPKNTKDAQVTKSIDEQSKFGLGETVSFPVTASVPRLAEGDNFTNFAIIDQMDSRLSAVKIDSVKLGGADVPAEYYSKSADGANPVKVWFNADGLKWLKTQNDKSVVVTFSGVVTSVGDGKIENTANYLIEHETRPEPPVDPTEPECEENCGETPTVHTNWGELQLKKVDSADNTATLQGAEFQVFAADDPYATDCKTTKPAGSAIDVLVNDKKTNVFTSDADGLVKVPGLFVSDSVNPTKDAEYRCYWVKETAAPAGYVLPANADTAVKVTKGGVTDVNTTIENTKTTVPTLPLTGGQGTMLLVGGGALLLLLGAVLFTVRRRQAVNS